MAGTNTLVLAGVLAVLLSVSQVDAAFKCYECTGTSDCSDTFTKSSSLESSGATCMSCTKTKYSGVVIRGCSSLAAGNSCVMSGDDAVCSCNSELCNGSTTLAVSMATLLGSALIVFVAKF